jgi:hypothetical protein
LQPRTAAIAACFEPRYGPFNASSPGLAIATASRSHREPVGSVTPDRLKVFIGCAEAGGASSRGWTQDGNDAPRKARHILCGAVFIGCANCASPGLPATEPLGPAPPPLSTRDHHPIKRSGRECNSRPAQDRINTKPSVPVAIAAQTPVENSLSDVKNPPLRCNLFREIFASISTIHLQRGDMALGDEP